MSLWGVGGIRFATKKVTPSRSQCFNPFHALPGVWFSKSRHILHHFITGMVQCQPITLGTAKCQFAHSWRALSWTSIIYPDQYNLFITQEYVIFMSWQSKKNPGVQYIFNNGPSLFSASHEINPTQTTWGHVSALVSRWIGEHKCVDLTCLES